MAKGTKSSTIILYRAEDERTVIDACDNSWKSHKQALHSFESFALDDDAERKPNTDTMKNLDKLYKEEIISLLVRTFIPKGKVRKGTSKKMELIDVLNVAP